MAKTYKDSECVDRIARDFVNNIIDGTESTVRKKIENAEYDKTFSCNILGINQVFSDEVKKDTQQYLIKTHDIPEISEKEEYYTVKIEGHYYCIKQASVYGMEQNVTVKVPNGEWNKMYISTAGKVKSLNVTGTVLGQVKFTAGRAYYNGEEYILQRGNNRRIIAVSKGDKCSIIDTPFEASEFDAETAATTAILKGLDNKATVEATFDVSKGERLGCYLIVDDIEGATVDWGDGTVEPMTEYNADHVYTISGSITQKITAPKATAVRIGGLSSKNGREAVLYIGGSIEEVDNTDGYAKMVVWGNNISQFQKGGWGSNIKYKCDVAVPPFTQSISGTWGNNVNYCYIPESCTDISGMQSGTFEQIEIEPKGKEMTTNGYALFGVSNYAGKSMLSISLPSRMDIASRSYLDLASGRCLKYIRFESGHTTIPDSFMNVANTGYNTSGYSKMYVYIPKTVTNIGTNAFHAPVHIVYEGTYKEWNKIGKDGFIVNNETYELSCPEYDYNKDGGLRYDNFESDIKNSNTKVDVNAGDGIDIDVNSNTVSVSVADDSGLSVVGGRLKALPANNDQKGIVAQGSADLSIAGGYLRQHRTMPPIKSLKSS